MNICFAECPEESDFQRNRSRFISSLGVLKDPPDRFDGVDDTRLDQEWIKNSLQCSFSILRNSFLNNYSLLLSKLYLIVRYLLLHMFMNVHFVE